MDIATILTKRYPDSEWTLSGDNYSGLNWLSDSPKKPSRGRSLDAPSGLRSNTRPLASRWRLTVKLHTASSADPIFFEFQRGDKTEAEWLDAVQAVKDANPYPVDPATIEPEPVVEPEIVEPEIVEVVEDGA